MTSSTPRDPSLLGHDASQFNDLTLDRDRLTDTIEVAEETARIGIQRRETGGVQTVLKVGDLEMNLIGRTVHRGTTEIDLQPREFQLLEFLMRHRGEAVTKVEILNSVWDMNFRGDENLVEVYISYLRRRIDAPFGCQAIQTIRGVGYRLAADGG